MRVVVFCHTLVSDWNHGNAHFLRGVVSDFIARGHEVRVLEPRESWSRANLVAQYGDGPVQRFHAAYPTLASEQYDLSRLDLGAVLDGADLVLVHEWNDPELVARVGRHRRDTRGYVLLFHDTHHRSVSAPEEMLRYDLEHYDGVLAFGESVAEVYRRRGWSDRVWTWHEAADTRLFRPMQTDKEGDLVWIGNWGDDERTAELHEFLIEPVHELRLRATVYGVRYPRAARVALEHAGIEYGGWAPNYEAPSIYARYRVTVHVPRRPYATGLRGVPTIRVFEALACCIPLVSAPWDDSEHLFTPGEDYLVALNGREMRAQLRRLLDEPDLAASVAAHGLQTMQRRHTCVHRVSELLHIYDDIRHASPQLAGGLLS
jgi:spore maturation protein CgeB